MKVTLAPGASRYPSAAILLAACPLPKAVIAESEALASGAKNSEPVVILTKPPDAEVVVVSAATLKRTDALPVFWTVIESEFGVRLTAVISKRVLCWSASHHGAFRMSSLSPIWRCMFIVD